MKKHLFITILLLLSLSGKSQTIQLKTALDAKAKTYLNFATEEFEGRLSAQPDHIDLTLRNTSSEALAYKNGDFLLTSSRGNGDELCADLLLIAPGKKVKVTLTRCKDADRIGLFGLKPAYKSYDSFSSDSTFLIDQEFILTIGTYKVRFYTDL